MLILQDLSINNERIWAVEAPYSWNDLIRVVKKVKPDAPVTDDYIGEEGEKKPQTTIDVTRATALLKPYGGFTGIEQTVREAFGA